MAKAFVTLSLVVFGYKDSHRNTPQKNRKNRESTLIIAAAVTHSIGKPIVAFQCHFEDNVPSTLYALCTFIRFAHFMHAKCEMQLQIHRTYFERVFWEGGRWPKCPCRFLNIIIKLQIRLVLYQHLPLWQRGFFPNKQINREPHTRHSKFRPDRGT